MTVVYVTSAEQTTVEDAMTRKIHRLAITAIICACALLSSCGGGADEPRALPNVTGMTLTQAERRLQSTNVSWVFNEEEGPAAKLFETVRESSGSANTALANRRVAAQDPKPGYKVTSGDVVLLRLRR
ncbi:MAG: PASTA domain-containing protein [Solirubrobacteraceae bacterium]